MSAWDTVKAYQQRQQDESTTLQHSITITSSTPGAQYNWQDQLADQREMMGALRKHDKSRKDLGTVLETRLGGWLFL
jgi:hypothetical protein